MQYGPSSEAKMSPAKPRHQKHFVQQKAYKTRPILMKLVIFTGMVNRIINSSRNERVTQQVLNRWTVQAVQATSVACTACTVPRFNPLWLLPLGLREGQSVCATTTREHTWFEEENYRGCWDHHTWLAEQSMAGIGLSPRCVPCDIEHL